MNAPFSFRLLFILGICTLTTFGCGSPTNEQATMAEEKRALLRHIDSLDALATRRIEEINALETAGKDTLAREMARLKGRLATEKDNLQVANRQNWAYVRDKLRIELIALEKQQERQ